jgi:hypothetical protein
MFLLLAGLFFILQIAGCLLMFEKKNANINQSNAINDQKDNDLDDENNEENIPIILKSKINSLGLE